MGRRCYDSGLNDTNDYRGMFDVSNKYNTLRSATAEGLVKVNSETIFQIQNGTSPKGDITEAAKISAVLGTKKHRN